MIQERLSLFGISIQGGVIGLLCLVGCHLLRETCVLAEDLPSQGGVGSEPVLEHGWRVSKNFHEELSVGRGDLNGDGREDRVMAIQPEGDASSIADGKLVIFERRADGSWKLVATLAPFDAWLAPELSIDRGVLTISWLWQGVGRTESNYFLKVRKGRKSEKYFVIGIESNDHDHFTTRGCRESVNLLTGMTKILKIEYSEKKQKDVERTSFKKGRPRPVRFERWQDPPGDRKLGEWLLNEPLGDLPEN